MSVKRIKRAARQVFALSAAMAVGGLGALVASVPAAGPAGATSPLAPTIYASNTGNGIPETITSYPFPSTGNITPTATLNSASPGIYHPYDMAFDHSGDLWVPSYNTGTISEYTPSELASTGNPTPHVTISGDDEGVGSIAFDGSGNLWALNDDANNLFEYSAADLTSSGSPAPTTTVSTSSNSIDDPYNIAFDSSGNLWLTDAGNDTLVELTPSQLSTGGPQAPTVTIGSNSGSLQAPTGLTFDSSGDLWVTNQSSGTVVEYTPAQQVNGSPVPHATVASDGSDSIYHPYGVRFDSSGDMWVTNSNESTVVEFTPGQLGSGTPTPAATLTANNTISPPSIDYVDSLAFDSSGNLWLTNYNANDLVRFIPSQLASGSPIPGVIISGTYQAPLDESTSLALDPSGNLWVTNDNGDNIVEYPSAVTGTSGSPEPSIVIGTGSCYFVCRPSGLAFDSAGDLWVSEGEANQIDEYTPSQLAASGDPTPAVWLSPVGLDSPEQLAFDPAGNLWITSRSNSSLVELSASQLTGQGVSPTPAATITGLDAEPYALAIDQSGNLWWSDCSDEKLTEFAASNLVSGPSPTPTSVISGPGCPQQMAFDSSGDLWEAGYGEGPIGEFTPAQLSAGGSPTPTDAIMGSHTGLWFPAGLALGQPPAVPGHVTASFATAAGVTWTAPFSVPWATGYSVTPVVNGVAQTPVDVGAGTTSYTLPGSSPTAGKRYAFKVAALNAFGSSAVVTSNTLNPIACSCTAPPPTGFWVVASDGGIFAFGGAQFYGSTGGMTLNEPIVGMAATPDGNGYWEVASDGGIFSFGDARFYGSTGAMTLNAPIVGMAATPDGKGYWLVAADGGVFTFGDARFYGTSETAPLAAPVVGIAATSDGKGYWEVAANGEVAPIGDAHFYGAAASVAPLNQPVVGIASTPDGKGYWEVAGDGGVFSYGDAQFHGSDGHTPPTPDVVGMAVTADAGGYLEAGAGGEVFAFGDWVIYPSESLPAGHMPIVGIARP